MDKPKGQAGASDSCSDHADADRDALMVNATGSGITDAMVAAGILALSKTMPLDIARPMLPEEEIVSRIYQAMRDAEIL